MVKDMYGREFTLTDMMAGVGGGWGGIVERLYNALDKHNVAVWQVKEKFGGLRFYVGSATEHIHQMIEEAEAESVKTCELCGRAGKQIDQNGWVTTRCEECADGDKK